MDLWGIIKKQISMKYQKILLTGGSGNLGQEIIKSGYFPKVLSPSRKVLDITEPKKVKKFFDGNDFDAVIHCAALARMEECEKNPIQAIKTNIIGTCNLVNEVINKNNKKKTAIRFLHISTDGVYPGISGNYSENDATIPYNKYGWTKLGSECAVNLLNNFCIIRTNFFEPNHIIFENSPDDSFSSKMPINELVNAICLILQSDFNGTVNVGSERGSDFEKYKHFKPSVKVCKLKDILKEVSFKMAQDSSLNINLWKKLKKDSKKRIANGAKF